MTSTLNKLKWDSDFFNINIGELIIDDSQHIEMPKVNNFDLIISKQYIDRNLTIHGFNKQFQETKYVFSKHLSKNANISSNKNVLDTDSNPIDSELLFDLAYESGTYSRFKLDLNFSSKSFKSLYQLWVLNSINKQFADKVFYIKHSNDTIVGFITIRKQNSFASIGLISISNQMQGQGLGSQLLKTAENYCLSQDLNELRIPTQKKNTLACYFYKKNGYSICEETIIKHYWKIN